MIFVARNKGSSAPPSAPWMSKEVRYVLGKMAICITVLGSTFLNRVAPHPMPAVLSSVIGKASAVPGSGWSILTLKTDICCAHMLKFLNTCLIQKREGVT